MGKVPQIQKEELQDIEAKAFTVEEMRAEQREYTKKLNTNRFELSAEVIEISSTTPKPICDRETKQPIIDEATGEMRFYPPVFTMVIAFKGGQKEVRINEQWYNDFKDVIGQGNRYMFTGRFGMVKNFGKETIDSIFQNYTLI